MSQIETTKLVSYAALGPLADNVVVSKLVAYALLVPGDGGDDGTGRQGHVYVQVVEN